MGRVRCYKISTADFEALEYKDGEVLYFVNDTGTFSPESLETGGRVYLGDKLLSLNAALQLASGLKIYINGNDVTNDESSQYLIQAAPSHWYGSQAAYNNLVDNNQVQPGVAYHIQVQPDWNETNTAHLGYIKNKPHILDMTVQNSTAKFFYL